MRKNLKLGWLTMALAAMLIAGVTGCVGYVGPDGGGVAVVGPQVDFWGGPYYRGHDARVYSHRGFASRGEAHGGWHR